MDRTGLVAVLVFVVGCHGWGRSASRTAGRGEPAVEARLVSPPYAPLHACNARPADPAARLSCSLAPRPVTGWGPVPRETTPEARCPIHVTVVGDEVLAEPVTIENTFADLPWDECIPPEYLLGARSTAVVEDGLLVAYLGVFSGYVYWAGPDREERAISGARVAGFTRSPRGTILALAIGRARLGRGGVLAFERDPASDARGAYRPRLVATLPLEPSPVAYSDEGRLVGFASRFLFRVDEDGRIENLHYISRAVGRVTSIAKDTTGRYYLGLECGILRLIPAPGGTFREEWWSASSGAAGRWTPCRDDGPAP